MDKLASQVTLKFAAMFNVGDIILYGKYKNKKGKILSFGKNDKGQPTIIVEPIPKGRKQNKEMGLYKIWTLPKGDQAKAKEDAKAEKAEKKAAALDPQLKQFADLLAAGLSDRKILQTMRISYNEAHQMAQELRTALGITSMDNLRKTLRMRQGSDDTKLAVYRRFYAQEIEAGHIDLHKEFPLSALQLSERVATRHVKAFGIPIGKIWDSGDVRIHRYNDSFKIWDLTNAGKRGKKVKWMSVSPSYTYKGDRAGWLETMSKALPDYESYGKIMGFFKDLLHDYPGEITIDEGEERGIDVNPGGTTEIRLKTNTGIEITSEPMSFLVKTHVPLTHHTTGEDIGFQDTLYWNRKKESAAIFYNWLKANMSSANKMDIQELTKLWDDMGVLWDSH